MVALTAQVGKSVPAAKQKAAPPAQPTQKDDVPDLLGAKEPTRAKETKEEELAQSPKMEGEVVKKQIPKIVRMAMFASENWILYISLAAMTTGAYAGAAYKGVVVSLEMGLIVLMAATLAALVFTKQPSLTMAEIGDAENELKKIKAKIERTTKNKKLLEQEREKVEGSLKAAKKEYEEIKNNEGAKALFTMWKKIGGQDMTKNMRDLVELLLGEINKVRKKEAKPEELKNFVERLRSFTIGTAAERRFILSQELGDQPEEFFRLFTDSLKIRNDPGRMTGVKKGEITNAVKDLLDKFRKIPNATEKDKVENEKEIARLKSLHQKGLDYSTSLVKKESHFAGNEAAAQVYLEVYDEVLEWKEDTKKMKEISKAIRSKLKVEEYMVVMKFRKNFAEEFVEPNIDKLVHVPWTKTMALTIRTSTWRRRSKNWVPGETQRSAWTRLQRQTQRIYTSS